MQEFNALRLKAKQKRDATIAKARQDYKQTIKQIARLKKAIIGTRPLRDQRCTLREAIVTVLGDRKLTATEITVYVMEYGYRSDMPKRGLHKYVTKLLRRDGRFIREGQKWAVSI